MSSEANILKRVMLAAAGKATLFRQNVGMAWAGHAYRPRGPEVVRVGPNDVVVRNARPFHAGVKGMSDTTGWTSIVVTPEMVGAKVAVFTAIETKSEDGAVRADQENFIGQVRAAGGRAGIARNEKQALAIIAGQ